MPIVWCEHALLPAGIAGAVALGIAEGRFTSVTPGVAPPAGAAVRRGLTIPGAANAHSHAFHRALRSRSQRERGTFWTWRDQMYALAARLDPDRYRRFATAVFGEMVLAGYTTVGEFHYVHHRPGGAPYADPNEMGDAIVAAAMAAGIRLTLLDTAYLHGGLGSDGHAPLGGHQRRFSDGSIDAWAERAGARTAPAGVRLGAAIHSVRALDPDAIGVVAAVAADAGWPLHAHVSEQPAENEQCLAAHGRTPTEVLRDAGALGPTFTAVHATHLTGGDVEALGDAGAAVCICPTTERDLADGVGPTRRLADADIRLCIGSDSHAVIDPFAEALAIELDQRLITCERGVHTTSELLSTLGAGHGALGWDDVGEIAVGHRADLVTLRLGSVRMAGVGADTLAEAVVYAAGAADVTDVMIDGVDVVTASRHRSVDVATELADCIAELTESTGATA
jgi:formiminoglutamate deiminase